MADRAIVDRAIAAAPKDYLVATNVELALKAVAGNLDGTLAGGAYLPAVQLIAPDETVMWTAVPPTPIAAGGSAVVSWFPGGGVDENEAAGGGSSSVISSLASPTATIQVGQPTGPAATVDLPTSGAAAGTY